VSTGAGLWRDLGGGTGAEFIATAVELWTGFGWVLRKGVELESGIEWGADIEGGPDIEWGDDIE